MNVVLFVYHNGKLETVVNSGSIPEANKEFLVPGGLGFCEKAMFVRTVEPTESKNIYWRVWGSFVEIDSMENMGRRV